MIYIKNSNKKALSKFSVYIKDYKLGAVVYSLPSILESSLLTRPRRVITSDRRYKLIYSSPIKFNRSRI